MIIHPTAMKTNMRKKFNFLTNSKSKKERRDAFLQTLRDKGVSSKIRRSRGKDIDAACGQLANKIVNAISN